MRYNRLLSLIFSLGGLHVLISQCTVTNITDFYDGALIQSENVKIDDGIIVWQAVDDDIFSGSNIYFYRNDTVREILGTTFGQGPDLHNGDIAFNNNDDVFIYKDGILTNISPTVNVPFNPSDVKIHNGTVVWQAELQNPMTAILWDNIYKFENGQTIALTNSIETTNRVPQLSDEYVVWEGGVFPSTGLSPLSEILAFDRRSNETRIISQEFGNVSRHNSDPFVSGDEITWHTLSSQFVTDIYRYTGDTLEIINSTSELSRLDNIIDNGQIAWSASSNGRFEVFLYANGQTQIATDTIPGFFHIRPKISDGRMVWISEDQDGRHFYYWAGDEAGPIDLAALVPDATPGSTDESGLGFNFGSLFDIWQNQIVWVGVKNGVNQVYRAVCESECPINLRLSNVIDAPGDIIPYAARDEIFSSQQVVNGGLSLSAPDIFIQEEFQINDSATLQIDNTGCNTD